MDPNANLEEMLKLAKRLLEEEDTRSIVHDSNRLSELVLAMDEWMSRGGFPPKKWEKTVRAAEALESF